MSYDDKLTTTRARLEAVARARGLEARWPEANELFIDIDSDAQFEAFKAAFARFLTVEPAATWHATPSPSGREGRLHVVVRLARPVAALERVFLQALLGSDTVREWLAWKNIGDGTTQSVAASVFFEKPEGA